MQISVLYIDTNGNFGILGHELGYGCMMSASSCFNFGLKVQASRKTILLKIVNYYRCFPVIIFLHTVLHSSQTSL